MLCTPHTLRIISVGADRVLAAVTRVFSSVTLGACILNRLTIRGLQLLTSVIIADITTLQWRGIVSGMTSLPFLVNDRHELHASTTHLHSDS